MRPSNAASHFRRRSKPRRAISSPAGTPTSCRRWSVPETRVRPSEVDALVKHYPVRGGTPRARGRHGPGGGRRVVRPCGGRNAGPRRRERLREIDDRQGDPAPGRAHQRHDHAGGRDHHGTRPRRDAPAPAPPAGDLSGSVRIAQSAHERGRDRRRAVAQLRHRVGRRADRARGAAVRARRPAARSDAQVPARIFRRAAPALRASRAPLPSSPR